MDLEELRGRWEDFAEEHDLDERKIARIAAVVLGLAALFLVLPLPSFAPPGQTIQVKVVDSSNGQPLQGASVLVTQDNALVAYKRTLDDGIAVLSGLPQAGNFSVRIQAPGYQDNVLLQVNALNTVVLKAVSFPSNTTTFASPLQPLPAFEVAGSGTAFASEGNALASTQQNNSAEAPQTTAPDCLQVSLPPAASAAPSISPSASASGQYGQRNFSILLGASYLLDGLLLNFTDYSTQGSVMLRVQPQQGNAFDLLLTSENNSAQIAGVRLQLVGVQNGSPPQASFSASFYSGVPTPQAGGQAGGQETAGGNALPQAAISSPSQGQLISSRTFVSGSASSPSGIYLVQVSFDGGASWNNASGGSEWAIALDYSQPGKMSIVARVTDCGGRTAQSTPIGVWASACKATVNHGPQQNKYNLVVVPSKYGGNYSKFAADADAALAAFFSTKPINTLDFFSRFNIYYYNGEADCQVAGPNPPDNRAWKCDLPLEFYQSCPFADLPVILVNSQLRAGKAGNPTTASSGDTEILAHELGHSILGLADEYCCDGGYWNDSTPNIFATERDCESETGKVCTQLGNLMWWASPPGIMNALETPYFDPGDLAAIAAFKQKYA